MAGEQDDPRRGPAEGGQDITVTEARSAQRVGLIWVLTISLVTAVVALLGYSTLNSRHMSTAGDGAAQAAAVGAGVVGAAPK